MVITPHHLFSSTSTQSSWPSWSRSPCCSSSCSSSSSPSGPPSPPSSTRSRGSLASYLLLLHYLPAYMVLWTEKRFGNQVKQLTFILPLPGRTSHGKRTGGERDVCRWEGAGSSFSHVVHPWVSHNMRDFLDKQNNKEQRRVSKIKTRTCRSSEVYLNVLWTPYWLLGCYCQIECSCTDRVLIHNGQTSTKQLMGTLFCNVFLCFSMKQIRILCQIKTENQGLDNKTFFSSLKYIYW